MNEEKRNDTAKNAFAKSEEENKVIGEQATEDSKGIADGAKKAHKSIG